MVAIKTLVECVPNFSEGRDAAIMDALVDAFRGRRGVKLLDYQSDADHNRMVVTAVGEPGPLQEAVVAAVGEAVARIDLRRHRGQHPRMGAADVIPFIPIRNVTMEEVVSLSQQVGAALAETYGLPIFLYERSASAAHRQNLADIRRGQFEQMPAKLKQSQWQPDYGPSEVHPSAGVTAVGARMPLVAYNVNLDTGDLSIADAIARKVRHSSGGLRYCKALGVELKDRGIVQVSMNMTDYTRTALYRVFELIRFEARRWGVNVIGSEVVGMVPMAALIDAAVYYLGVENFSADQVLESRLME
jgi:glutamate formiminotransferase